MTDNDTAGVDKWRIAAVAMLLFAVLLLVAIMPIAGWLDQAADWSRANPVLSALIFLAAFSIGPVLLVPGSIFAMAAGYLWGLPTGTFLASLGATLGAFAAFMNGRTLARRWATQKMQAQPRLLALDQALREQSFLVVILTRLSLLIPYNLLNYAYGVTGVRRAPYFVASAIGLVPAMTFYTYVGTLAQNFDDILSGRTDSGTAGKLYVAVGLLAVVITALIVHRLATRALQKRLGE